MPILATGLSPHKKLKPGSHIAYMQMKEKSLVVLLPLFYPIHNYNQVVLKTSSVMLHAKQYLVLY